MNTISPHVHIRLIVETATLRELFGRIAFNMACGNTDDHGRNHAAFVGTKELELTPAYDICPQARSGESASQAMAYDTHGNRDARFSLLLDAAPLYLLDRQDASDTIHNHPRPMERSLRPSRTHHRRAVAVLGPPVSQPTPV
jgi:hypothetical protein